VVIKDSTTPRTSRYTFDIFTGSNALCAMRRYLRYSEADVEVFRPAGASRCTDGGEIWHGGGGEGTSSSVHRHRCNG